MSQKGVIMAITATNEITLTIDVTRNEDDGYTASISKPGDEYFDGVSDLSEISSVAVDMAELVRETIIEAFEEPIEFKRADS